MALGPITSSRSEQQPEEASPISRAGKTVMTDHVDRLTRADRRPRTDMPNTTRPRGLTRPQICRRIRMQGHSSTANPRVRQGRNGILPHAIRAKTLLPT